MENLDVQTVGSGGVLGAALLFLAQQAVARFWPAQPKPAPDATPAPQPTPPATPTPAPAPAPATAPARATPIKGVLADLARVVMDARLAGPLTDEIREAAAVAREILAVIPPPATPKG